MKRTVLFAGVLGLVGCGSPSSEPGEPSATETAKAVPSSAPAAPRPATPANLPVRLSSKDCGEVVDLYLQALRTRDYAVAAMVWDDPAIDGARLAAVFGGYGELQLEHPTPVIEGAAGSLYCTVAGNLTDARDPAKPAVQGELVLKRVNDVPGATPDQLRWTLRESTFVEPLARSGGGKP